jgi:hypothetical protein
MADVDYEKKNLSYGRQLADPLYGWRVVTSLFFTSLMEYTEDGVLRQAALRVKLEKYFEAMAFVLHQIRYNDSSRNNDFRGAFERFIDVYTTLIEEAEEMKEPKVQRVLLALTNPSAPTTPAFVATVEAMTRLFSEIEVYLVVRRDLNSPLSSINDFNTVLFREIAKNLSKALAFMPFVTSIRNDDDPREVELRQSILYNVELVSSLMYTTINMTDCVAEEINLAILRSIYRETLEQQAKERTCSTSTTPQPKVSGYNPVPQPKVAGYKTVPRAPAPTVYTSMPEPPRSRK